MTPFPTSAAGRSACLAALCLALVTVSSTAAITGTNVPAQPLSPQRIAELPAKQQSAWKDYLKRSAAQRRTDQVALQKEMGRRGLSNSIPAPSSRGTRSTPLQREAAWYASVEAKRVADIVISFQTPSGGWSKNIDLAKHEREAGEEFAPENTSRFLGTGDFETLGDQRWSYVGTIDNSGTTTPLRFLAKVITANKSNRPYKKSFERGVAYLLAAQNPNGGWPQVWPLQGGYHDAITYNDSAMVNVLRLLQDVAAGQNEFEFTSRSLRKRANASVARGMSCLLDTQIIANGRRTVWCQQHDALTLQPTSARNYEMPSLCSSESAGILSFLMEQPKPDSNIVAAVHGAAAWFEKTQIRGMTYRRVGDEGRKLVASPDSGSTWARYYEIGSDRPIFGDRDKSIHDVVDEISRERRDSYAWFSDGPDEALKQFAKWSEAQKQQAGR
jgi:PelA/Pel-15E family pectate lyase